MMAYDTCMPTPRRFEVLSFLVRATRWGIPANCRSERFQVIKSHWTRKFPQ